MPPAPPLDAFCCPLEAKPLNYSRPGLPHPLHRCLPGQHGQPALPTIQRLSGQGRGHQLTGKGERDIRTLINSVATQVQKEGFGPAHFAQLLLAVLRTTLFPLLHGGPATPHPTGTVTGRFSSRTLF